jgi:hypothetical protein
MKSSSHGRMNYTDTEPRLFFKTDLLTDFAFAALFLTDFIEWRYIHSWLVFSTQPVNLLLYFCPSTFSLTSPPPPSQTQCTVYTDSVWLCGGGGVELCCKTIFCRSFTVTVSESTKLLHYPKQKWPVKTTLGIVVFKVPSSMPLAFS